MRSVGMHGNKLILVIFSFNIPQNPQEMGTFFISDFLRIMGHPNVYAATLRPVHCVLCVLWTHLPSAETVLSYWSAHYKSIQILWAKKLFVWFQSRHTEEYLDKSYRSVSIILVSRDLSQPIRIGRDRERSCAKTNIKLRLANFLNFTFFSRGGLPETTGCPNKTAWLEILKKIKTHYQKNNRAQNKLYNILSK